MGEPQLGEVSYVESIEIHCRSHELGNTNVFALKTFEERMAPGLSKRRHRREVTANLEVHKHGHDRIVRLLAAFSYRERFYLIFPLATEGSLKQLWKDNIIEGITQVPAQASIAEWYTETWLTDECLGIAEALLATHGSIDGILGASNGFLHADIKPENILCFSKYEKGKKSIVLKLADFGEATRARSDLTASTTTHLITYRPPEHSPGTIVTLNYDVWCLGCLFLEFVTWALFGPKGIELFAQDRENEPDEAAVTENPGQIIEDTFFKMAEQGPRPFILKGLRMNLRKEMKVCSRRATTTHSLCISSHADITPRLKAAVIRRLTPPEQDPQCSDRLKQLLSFIRERMLVVDPGRRASSFEVRDHLKQICGL